MEIREHTSVQKWLNNLRENTQRTNLNGFKLWMNWLQENDTELGQLSPDELIKYQQLHKDYRILRNEKDSKNGKRILFFKMFIDEGIDFFSIIFIQIHRPFIIAVYNKAFFTELLPGFFNASSIFLYIGFHPFDNWLTF